MIALQPTMTHCAPPSSLAAIPIRRSASFFAHSRFATQQCPRNTKKVVRPTSFVLYFVIVPLSHPLHTHHTNRPTHPKEIPKYEASSPDELALLEASAAFGVLFVHRERTKVRLQLPSDNGQHVSETYDWLAELEFSSDRKRMSVVLRSHETNELWLYCKGADTVIMPLLVSVFLSMGGGLMVGGC